MYTELEHGIFAASKAAPSCSLKVYFSAIWGKSLLYNRSRYHKWNSQSSHQTPIGCLSITFYVQSCTEWGSDITFSAGMMLPNHKLDCITKVILITLDVKIALIHTHAAPTARNTHTHTHTGTQAHRPEFSYLMDSFLLRVIHGETVKTHHNHLRVFKLDQNQLRPSRQRLNVE